MEKAGSDYFDSFSLFYLQNLKTKIHISFSDSNFVYKIIPNAFYLGASTGCISEIFMFTWEDTHRTSGTHNIKRIWTQFSEYTGAHNNLLPNHSPNHSCAFLFYVKHTKISAYWTCILFLFFFQKVVFGSFLSCFI